jgi:hypothetical protein
MSDHKYDTASLNEKEQFWLGHIRKWRKSGQIGREYSAANGIKAGQLFQWVSYFRSKGWPMEQDDEPVFQRVNVVEKIPSVMTTPEGQVFGMPLTARIHLPNGVMVELPGLESMAVVGDLLCQSVLVP